MPDTAVGEYHRGFNPCAPSETSTGRAGLIYNKLIYTIFEPLVLQSGQR